MILGRTKRWVWDDSCPSFQPNWNPAEALDFCPYCRLDFFVFQRVELHPVPWLLSKPSDLQQNSGRPTARQVGYQGTLQELGEYSFLRDITFIHIYALCNWSEMVDRSINPTRGHSLIGWGFSRCWDMGNSYPVKPRFPSHLQKPPDKKKLL